MKWKFKKPEMSKQSLKRAVKKKIASFFANDVGIDLGTANTLVYVNGKGIVINEPSIVAINQKTEQVVAVGQEAKAMLGRTPEHITAVQPLVDGVISDYEVTEEMLSYLIRKAQDNSNKLFGPRVVVGVPSGITNVEVRAVQDAAKSAGAREVYIIEEPMAAAIGIGLPVHEPTGSMLIDIGGGTTDIGVVSLGGLVNTRNVRIAGDKLNENIKEYIRQEFKILIGDKSAEEIKIKISSVDDDEEERSTTVRGRDLVTGLPREIIITNVDIKDAVYPSVERLVEATKEVLETTPPEIVADIYKRGIYICGGGANIKGLDRLISKSLGVKAQIAEDPLTAVVRGAGMVLEDLDKYKDVLISESHEFSPVS